MGSVLIRLIVVKSTHTGTPATGRRVEVGVCISGTSTVGILGIGSVKLDYF